MHTPDSLLDVHERTHRSLQALLDHCTGLDDGIFDRELEDFAYPSLRLQLHHVLGAERYWIGVLEGRIQVDEEDGFPDLAALVAYRGQVADATRTYLRGTAPDDLNEPRAVTTWGGRERILRPADVIMRTQTHHFIHLGQILAMLRRLGHPARGLDYPLT